MFYTTQAIFEKKCVFLEREFHLVYLSKLLLESCYKRFSQNICEFYHYMFGVTNNLQGLDVLSPTF